MKNSERLISGVLSTVLALGGVNARSRRNKSQRSVLHHWSTQEVVGVGVGIVGISTLMFLIGKSNGASEKNDQNAKDIGCRFGLKNGIDMSELKSFLRLVDPQRAKRLEISGDEDSITVRLPGSGESSDYIDDKGNCYRDCEVEFGRINLGFGLGVGPDPKLVATKVVLSNNGGSSRKYESPHYGFVVPKRGGSPYEGSKYNGDLADCANLLYNLLECFLELELRSNRGICKTLVKNSDCDKQFFRNLAKIYVDGVICAADVKLLNKVIDKSALLRKEYERLKDTIEKLKEKNNV